MINHGHKNFLFSSNAIVYGNYVDILITWSRSKGLVLILTDGQRVSEVGTDGCPEGR